MESFEAARFGTFGAQTFVGEFERVRSGRFRMTHGGVQIYRTTQDSVPVRKLMLIGDSLTAGWGDGVAFGTKYGGFRPYLKLALGSRVDFVGPVFTPNYLLGEGYEYFNDVEHAGQYGWRADQITNGNTSFPGNGKLSDWLATYAPTHASLLIGANDINQTAQTTASAIASEAFPRIQAVIDYLVDTYGMSSSRLHVCAVPRRNETSSLKNDGVAATNVSLSAYCATRSVSYADLTSGFTIGAGSADYYDTIHWSVPGYVKATNILSPALAARL